MDECEEEAENKTRASVIQSQHQTGVINLQDDRGNPEALARQTEKADRCFLLSAVDRRAGRKDEQEGARRSGVLSLGYMHLDLFTSLHASPWPWYHRRLRTCISRYGQASLVQTTCVPHSCSCTAATVLGFASFHRTMESRLAQFATLNQKDKATAYQSLLAEVLAQEDQSNLHAEIHTLIDNAVNQESVGLVISRGILSELVKALSEGKVRNTEQRKRIVEDTLSIVQPRIVSYEEQVSADARSEDTVALRAARSGELTTLPTSGHSRGGGAMERRGTSAYWYLTRFWPEVSTNLAPHKPKVHLMPQVPS